MPADLAPAPRAAEAARLRPYFDLQLTFAEHLGAATGLGIGEAVALYTTFRTRMGLQNDSAPAAAAWNIYLARLPDLPDRAARSDWTAEVFAALPAPPPIPPGQTGFGCFACEAPDGEGRVRIHFGNRDSDGDIGPLDERKRAARMAELTAMFTHLRDRHPDAASVHGASWLYNTRGYRRLFPSAYGASAIPPEGPVRLTGTSSWGQFLDFRQDIKTPLRDAFLARFGDLDPAAPWRIFPLWPLRTQAPFADFLSFYGLT